MSEVMEAARRAMAACGAQPSGRGVYKAGQTARGAMTRAEYEAELAALGSPARPSDMTTVKVRVPRAWEDQLRDHLRAMSECGWRLEVV